MFIPAGSIEAEPFGYPDGFFVGWTVTCQLINTAGVILDTISATWLDSVTTRALKLEKVDTSTWALGDAAIQVTFTRNSDGFKLVSTKAKIKVVV
jgi:hypothetical protein